MKKLLFMLLFGAACNAQITIGPPNDLTVCDINNDGVVTFNLDLNTATVLNGLDSTLHIVTYHETFMDAQVGANPIENITTYSNVINLTVNGEQAMYVRVSQNSSENFALAEFALITVHAPSFSLYSGTYCVDYSNNLLISPYVLNTGLTSGNYTFEWQRDGVVIPNATQSSFSASEAGIYSVTVTNAEGCTTTKEAFVTKSSHAAPIGDGYSIDGQTISVMVEGFGEYMYQIDNGPLLNSPIFENVPYGIHQIGVYDGNGCGTLIFEVNILTPDSPTGEPNQDFTPGDTLADLEVEGENIQWYDAIGPDSTMETPLPLTTLLVDGTTYYASQTINGEESAERLAVTVHSTMGVAEQTLNTLSYYPNPVINTLTLSNSDVIDSIEVYNIMGQLILNKNISNDKAELDLSHLNSGLYILKLSSSGQQKTIKIQKQ